MQARIWQWTVLKRRMELSGWIRIQNAGFGFTGGVIRSCTTSEIRISFCDPMWPTYKLNYMLYVICRPV